MQAVMLAADGSSELNCIDGDYPYFKRVKLPESSYYKEDQDIPVKLEYIQYNQVGRITLPNYLFEPEINRHSDLLIYVEKGVKEVHVEVAYNNETTDGSWRCWASNSYVTHTSDAFIQWTSDTACSIDNDATNFNFVFPKQQLSQETEEQKRERLAREEAVRVAVEKRAEEQKRENELRTLSEKKALELLLDNLDINQKEIYEKTGAITVKPPSGRQYQIDGKSGSIYELNSDGRKVKSICIHPQHYSFPLGDAILAKKLMFEICEEEARKIGHFSDCSA
jgi:hypothetical protein